MTNLTVKLDSAALKHNIEVISKLIGNKSIIAMLKANAYGHGLLPIAELLPPQVAIGVATIAEAIKLREGNINNRIVLMHGVLSIAEISEASRLNLEVVVHTNKQISLLIEAQKQLIIWLKINTGMNRLGFDAEDFNQALSNLKPYEFISLKGVMTHLACADEIDNPATLDQIEYFEKITANLKVKKSIANSAAILAWPNALADEVRPGIMLYGISPFPDSFGHKLGLKPVMSLNANVVSINKVEAGSGIGYNFSFVAKEDMLVATVRAGYGDGLMQVVPPNTPIFVAGRKTIVLGKLSMDLMAIDITNIKNVNIGDSVEIWGKNLPIEEVAQHIDVSAYQLCSTISATRVDVIVE